MKWPGQTTRNGNGTRPLWQSAPSLAEEVVIEDRPYSYTDTDPEDELDEDTYSDVDGDEDAPLGGRELPRIAPTITWDEIRWQARYTRAIAGRHCVRTPKYMLRTLRWAPIGIARTIRNLYRWETDAQGRSMIGLSTEEWDKENYLRLKRQHEKDINNRLIVFTLAACVLSGCGMVGWYLYPWHTVASACGLVWLAAWYGAPSGTIIDHVQPASPELRKWDTGVIRRAFEAAGLSKPPKEGMEAVYGDEIMFVSDPRRDGPNGTSCIIDLRLGDTAAKALKAKDQLASGLSVGKMQLFITPDEDSERRIELYIHDKDPYREQAPLTPLADAAKWNFWEGVPFGVSARGLVTWVNLLWTHMLIGAMPRVGKSFAARQIAAAAALDPYVRLIIFNGRPDGAWSMFEQVAHRYGKGERDDVVDQLIATLEDCCEDIQRRSEKLDEMKDRVPESKITEEISRTKSLNMPLVLLCIDEFHLYVGSRRQFKGRQTCGQRILELLTYIVKVGGATGYMTILATQKPDTSIAKEITAMRDNMELSFCLLVKTSDVARAILGVIPPGLNPALLFSRRHIGVGVLIGGRDETGDVDEYGRVVRTYWADDETIDEICQRGHRLRDRLGVLSGHAAGDSPQDRPPDRLLDHILELAGPAEDKLWTSVVLDRLTAEWPDLYSGWTEDTLRGHLKRWDVSTSTQIHRTMRDGSRSNQRGIVLSEVEEALARKLDGHATAGRNGNGSNGNNP